MGSLCQLKFDSISLLEQKSCVPDEFVCLFQESDRRELQKIEGEERDSGITPLGRLCFRDLICLDTPPNMRGVILRNGLNKNVRPIANMRRRKV